MYKSKYLEKIKRKPPVAKRGKTFTYMEPAPYIPPNASQLARQTFQLSNLGAAQNRPRGPFSDSLGANFFGLFQ